MSEVGRYSNKDVKANRHKHNNNHTERRILLVLSDSLSLRWLHKNYQQALTIRFAVEEINRDPVLLPNISLGFYVYNAYHSDERTLESSLRWLTGEEKNYLMRIYNFPRVFFLLPCSLSMFLYCQLSFGPFDSILSDKAQFPSLYQMAPRDSSLYRGIVQVLVHFKWTWIGLVTTDDLRGEEFLRAVTGEMAKHDVCAAFTEKVPVSERRHEESELTFMPRIMASPSRVIVIHGDTDSLMILRYSQIFLFSTLKVWIATSHWDITMRSSTFESYNFYGALTFKYLTSEVPGFKSFLNSIKPNKDPEDIVLKDFWLSVFWCKKRYDDLGQENCAPNATLEALPIFVFDMTMSGLSYTIYNAVYAVAWALHEMLLTKSEIASEKAGERRNYEKEKIKNLKSENTIAGDLVFMDEKRSSEAQYDIQNYMSLPNDTELLVKVGHFIPSAPPGEDFTIGEEVIDWGWLGLKTPQSVFSESCHPGYRKTIEEGKPVCCFICSQCPEGEVSTQTDVDHCEKCPEDEYPNKEIDHCLSKVVTFLDITEPLGMTLALTAVSFSFLTALVLWVFIKFRDTPIVKANNRALSYILLISLTFCLLCSLLFLGRPTATTCFLRQTTFGVVFTVAVVTTPGRRIRTWMQSRMSNSVVLIFSGVQVILCGIWLGTSPPFPDTDPHSESSHIIIKCNEGSDFAFYSFLGYMGFLALGSFTVAFLARNLPDTFNEAKFITFSMLVFCSVWVSFLPMYQSTRGKAMVVVEIFSILASSAGLLGCIFIPKCHVILLRPERNIQEQIKKKVHSKG
uniref:G-protein coupled receptors family 3 profile domain-containing protein n=1 Tax=Sarcophilus harrisii TaxID=9305 RepID=A0A7N4NP10_SARHA